MGGRYERFLPDNGIGFAVQSITVIGNKDRWDEPLLKATFAVTLISRTDTVNLSNTMPVSSEKEYHPEPNKDSGDTVSSLIQWFSASTTQDTSSSEKWKITRFEITPPMSSYIVAFANGHFDASLR